MASSRSASALPLSAGFLPPSSSASSSSSASRLGSSGISQSRLSASVDTVRCRVSYSRLVFSNAAAASSDSSPFVDSISALSCSCRSIERCSVARASLAVRNATRIALRNALEASPGSTYASSISCEYSSWALSSFSKASATAAAPASSSSLVERSAMVGSGRRARPSRSSRLDLARLASSVRLAAAASPYADASLGTRALRILSRMEMSE
mmetsp:Transcript_9804/g.28042  ORF Transcript_9804/g.28042 Transcript_9804/m.28042 type:complete len:211 (+) Transcript_9804:7829-8461(+)